MSNLGICIPICAGNSEEFTESIRRAAAEADVLELRLDCLPENEWAMLLPEIFNLKKTLKNRFLVTFRPAAQGGKRDLTIRERLKFWEFFFANKNSDDFLVDFEYDIFEALNFKSTRVVRSLHHFSGDNFRAEDRFRFLSAVGGDIFKLAVQADDISDSIPTWKLLETAKFEKKPIVPIAMGEAGKWTRILGLAHGAAMTYAALDPGLETASGQITAREMRDVYRVTELNRETKVYGIIGDPVKQSVSPAMHNAAFKFHNLNSVYIPFEVKKLADFLSRMVEPETREVDLNFAGFSVTVPHKTEIIKHLDLIDETARKIGAVNTVKIEDGKLCGYNTDAAGFIEPLLNSYGDLKNANVAILGAGGAARAAIYALKNANANVVVFARNLKKAEPLAEEFDVKLKELSKIEDRRSKTDFNRFDIVVNTTPLGMLGKAENETPLIAGQIENVKLIYDLVYNPFETEFLRQARSVSVPTISGLAMLVAQGVRQFEIWTGLQAPLKEMGAAALERLK